MDKLREGAQGRIAKIIFWLIIFSFSLAGVGSYLNRPANTDPAEVNGEPITAQALENAYRNERSRLEAQLGENFAQLADNPAYLQRMRQGVLERMIDDVLVNQAIKDAKLRVGDEQVKKAILAMPYFQKDGKFDNDLYLAVLRQNNLTPEGFRDTVRQDLATQDYLGAVSQSEFALPAEARLLDRLLNQTRDVRLYTLPLAAFSGAVQVTDEERKAFYDAHPDQFMSQEQVAINYLLLDVDKIAAGISPSDADVQAYYDQHPYLYMLTPQQSYKLHLFAGVIVDASGYILDGNGQVAYSDCSVYQFQLTQEFLQQMVNHSTFRPTTGVPSADSHIVTLSTCTYEFKNVRYVVLGVLEPIQ